MNLYAVFIIYAVIVIYSFSLCTGIDLIATFKMTKTDLSFVISNKVMTILNISTNIKIICSNVARS